MTTSTHSHKPWTDQGGRVTPTHVIKHDPLGEADLANGATIGGTARFCRYRR